MNFWIALSSALLNLVVMIALVHWTGDTIEYAVAVSAVGTAVVAHWRALQAHDAILRSKQ